jgi:hypothetical protein
VNATYIVLIVAVVLLLGVYVSWRAGRLDRLHARVEAARTALDLALERRSSAAAELASSGLLDPATSLLIAGAVEGARARSDGVERDLAESDLTRSLRAAFSQPGFSDSVAGAEELTDRVQAGAHQVFLARKFYNDAVAATREARNRPLARVFRLAGKATEPGFFEMDDSLVD